MGWDASSIDQSIEAAARPLDDGISGRPTKQFDRSIGLARAEGSACQPGQAARPPQQQQQQRNETPHASCCDRRRRRCRRQLAAALDQTLKRPPPAPWLRSGSWLPVCAGAAFVCCDVDADGRRTGTNARRLLLWAAVWANARAKQPGSRQRPPIWPPVVLALAIGKESRLIAFVCMRGSKSISAHRLVCCWEPAPIKVWVLLALAVRCHAATPRRRRREPTGERGGRPSPLCGRPTLFGIDFRLNVINKRTQTLSTPIHIVFTPQDSHRPLTTGRWRPGQASSRRRRSRRRSQ